MLYKLLNYFSNCLHLQHAFNIGFDTESVGDARQCFHAFQAIETQITDKTVLWPDLIRRGLGQSGEDGHDGLLYLVYL